MFPSYARSDWFRGYVTLQIGAFNVTCVKCIMSFIIKRKVAACEFYPYSIIIPFSIYFFPVL